MIPQITPCLQWVHESAFKPLIREKAKSKIGRESDFLEKTGSSGEAGQGPKQTGAFRV